MQPKQAGFGVLTAIVLLAVIAVILGAGVIIYHHQQTPHDRTSTSKSTAALAAPDDQPTVQIQQSHKPQDTPITIGGYVVHVPGNLNSVKWLKDNSALGPVCIVGVSMTLLPDPNQCRSPETGSVQVHVGNGKIDDVVLRYPQGMVTTHEWQTMNGIRAYHYETVNIIHTDGKDYSFSESAYRFPLADTGDQWVEIYSDDEESAPHSEAMQLVNVYGSILHSIATDN